MHLEGLIFQFQKTVLFIMLFDMAYCFRDIKVWSWRILLNFCWVISFDISIAYILWTVAQTP